MIAAVRRIVLVVVLALVLGTAVAPLPAQAVDYPGGRRIYTVALGAIPAPGATGTTWVRLAMYYFNGNGTVRQGFWLWSRSAAVGAADTGITSTGCDDCQVVDSRGRCNTCVFPHVSWGS